MLFLLTLIAAQSTTLLYAQANDVKPLPIYVPGSSTPPFQYAILGRQERELGVPAGFCSKGEEKTWSGTAGQSTIRCRKGCPTDWITTRLYCIKKNVPLSYPGEVRRLEPLSDQKCHGSEKMTDVIQTSSFGPGLRQSGAGVVGKLCAEICQNGALPVETGNERFFCMSNATNPAVTTKKSTACPKGYDEVTSRAGFYNFCVKPL